MMEDYLGALNTFNCAMQYFWRTDCYRLASSQRKTAIAGHERLIRTLLEDAELREVD